MVLWVWSIYKLFNGVLNVNHDAQYLFSKLLLNLILKWLKLVVDLIFQGIVFHVMVPWSPKENLA